MATDAAGNTGNSAVVTVTVNNSVQQLLQNTGFETGNLTFWNAGGVYLPVVTSAKHNTGTYSAQLGSSVTPEPTETRGCTGGDDAEFDYGGFAELLLQGCVRDTVANDWQEAQIQNSSGECWRR